MKKRKSNAFVIIATSVLFIESIIYFSVSENAFDGSFKNTIMPGIVLLFSVGFFIYFIIRNNKKNQETEITIALGVEPVFKVEFDMEDYFIDYACAFLVKNNKTFTKKEELFDFLVSNYENLKFGYCMSTGHCLLLNDIEKTLRKVVDR